jgi:hypothetical protein
MSASDYISSGLQAYAGYELADEGILSAEQAAINAKLQGDALQTSVMTTAEFQPYSVVSSTGSTVNVDKDGGINVNLSPREQSIQDSALAKTKTNVSQLGTKPSAISLGSASTNAFVAANQPNALTGAGQGALLSTGPSALATSGEQAYRNLSDDPLSQMATDQYGNLRDDPLSQMATNQYGNLQPNYLTTKSQGKFDTLGRDARTQGLLSQSDNYFNTAAMSPSQAQAYLYEQMRAVQRPEEQRQRLALEERMMSQGRLGFSSSVYGGASPELLAQAKAIEEARAGANLTARQQAMKESQQAFDRGTGLLTSTNEMRAQNLKEAASMFEAGTTRDKLALDTASSLADTGLAREKLSLDTASSLADTGLAREKVDTDKAESMFEAGMTQERQDVDRAETVFESGLTQEESDMLNAARLQDAGFAITDQQIENLNTAADIGYRPQEEALAATGYGIDASNIATRAGSNAAQYQTDIGTATMESVMQAEQLQSDLKRQQMTNLVSTLFQGGTNADGTPMDSMVDSTVDTILDWVFGDDEASAWNVGDADYFTEGSGGGGEYEASEAELDAASNF